MVPFSSTIVRYSISRHLTTAQLHILYKSIGKVKLKRGVAVNIIHDRG